MPKWAASVTSRSGTNWTASIIGPALEQIWVGDATPEDVLPALCEQVNGFLADNGYPK